MNTYIYIYITYTHPPYICFKHMYIHLHAIILQLSHPTTFQLGVEAYLDLCEQPGNPMPQPNLLPFGVANMVKMVMTWGRFSLQKNWVEDGLITSISFNHPLRDEHEHTSTVIYA